MSVELRRLVIDPQLDPQIARIGTVVNRLVDMANGNGGGRLWLLHDDGNKKATSGSSGVLPGAVLSANNYPLRVEPTSTNQVNVLHSNGATVGLRVQDGGLTTGVPASLTSTLAVTGATTLSSTLAVTGATTLSSTLAVTGATTLNGAVTLGDAAADVITVTGTATVAEILTLTKGLVVDTTTMVVDAVNNRVGILTATPLTTLDIAGAMRSTLGTDLAATGSGLELYYNGAAGVVQSYNRTGAAFLPLLMLGLNVVIYGNGTERIKADGTGLGFFNKAPAAQPAAGAAAGGTLAQVTTLANDLRTGLRDLGLFS